MKRSISPRFEVLRTLKQSSTCASFLVNDQISGRSNVVLKVVRKGHFKSDRQALSEYFAWQIGIEYPFLANVFDAGITSAQDLYYVREYFSEPEFLADPALIGQLLNAVALMHSKGRVHGRIQYSNLFVSAGALRLADAQPRIMPLAEYTDEDVRFTAPEVLRGENPTVESDLYSLGAVLYRIHSGRDPFDDLDLENLRYKYMWAAPQPLLNVCHVAEELSEVIAQLLSRNPPERRAAYSALLKLYKRPQTAARRAPVVGRRCEIKNALNFLHGSALNGLRVLVIRGEPGIGKSRLIDELRIRSGFSSEDFVVTGCRESGTKVLEPIVAGVRQLLHNRVVLKKLNRFEELGGFRANLSQQIIDGALCELLERPKSSHDIERRLNAIVALVAKVCSIQRSTLVIEDVHWADEVTVRLIRQLCYRAPELSLRLILTADLETLELSETLGSCLGKELLEIRLGPLRSEDSLDLVSYFDDARDRNDKIVGISAGNPLFLEKYATETDPDTLPEALNKLIQFRLHSLPQTTWPILRSLSLFNEPIEAEHVRAIAQTSEAVFQNGVKTLLVLGLVEGNKESLSFRHAAVRKKIYSSLARSMKVRLHRAAYETLRENTSDQELLAEHAFVGRLHEPAAALHEELGRKYWHKVDYRSAARHFEDARRSRVAQGQQMSPPDEVLLARCYALMGKPTKANTTYDRLLSLPAVQEAPELLSTIYAHLALAEHKQSGKDRIRLLRLSIACLPPNSPTRSRRYALLSNALTRIGDFTAAQQAIDTAQTSVIRDSTNDIPFIEATHARILASMGRYKEAYHLLRRSAASHSTDPVYFNNLCVILEQLGRLGLAKKMQARAQAHANALGYVALQAMSFCNLGVISSKLGEFVHAKQLFYSGTELASRVRSQDREFDLADLDIIDSDAARFYAESGKYHKALYLLNRLQVQDAARHYTNNLNIGLSKCHLYASFGAAKPVREMLKVLESMHAFDFQFYEIERWILEAHLETNPTDVLLEQIERAIEVSRQLGTVFQRCQLEIALARLLIRINRKSDAFRQAKLGYRIALKKGYEPLSAHALLALGLSVEDNRAAERWLSNAYRLADEIGMPELVAESAYHIGLLQYKAGQFLTAKEYLLKSVATTSRLAEEVPAKFRLAILPSCGVRKPEGFWTGAPRSLGFPSYRLIGRRSTSVETKYSSAVSTGLRLQPIPSRTPMLLLRVWCRLWRLPFGARL